MSGKVLKILIYVWGAICLVIFVAIRFEPLFNSLLKEKVIDNYWDRTEYGEMYYFSMIRHFREPGLPAAQDKFEYSEKMAQVKDAQILAFGDSFFEFSRHKQFPERFADDFHKKVHFVKDDSPLEYLNENGYQDSIPKLVLYERTERFIPISFDKEHVNNFADTEGKQRRLRLLAQVKDKLFYSKSEDLYSVILKRSYLTTDLYSLVATLKFDLYGSISKLTPAYLKNGSDSWLFYHDQLNGEKTSYYYDFSQSEIDSICDNMASLANKLRYTYNLHLLYLPIPAKYTLYHNVINDDPYNDFLPRLYKGLTERGVRFVNIFNDYRNSPDTLYYHTDSHWNQQGIDMAYSKTVEYIQNDTMLNMFLK